MYCDQLASDNTTLSICKVNQNIKHLMYLVAEMVEVGGGGLGERPLVVVSDRASDWREIIWIWTGTQGKVHRAPHMFLFAGMLPWRSHLKLKMRSFGLCSLCNQLQMKDLSRCGSDEEQQQLQQRRDDVKPQTYTRNGNVM